MQPDSNVPGADTGAGGTPRPQTVADFTVRTIPVTLDSHQVTNTVFAGFRQDWFEGSNDEVTFQVHQCLMSPWAILTVTVDGIHVREVLDLGDWAEQRAQAIADEITTAWKDNADGHPAP